MKVCTSVRREMNGLLSPTGLSLVGPNGKANRGTILCKYAGAPQTDILRWMGEFLDDRR